MMSIATATVIFVTNFTLFHLYVYVTWNRQ